MTSLTDYILINHHLMTVKEMAEETGEKEPAIRYLCDKLGVVPVKENDRIKEYIQNNPDAVLQDVAEQFGRSEINIYKLSAEIGVKLKTQGQQHDWLTPKDMREVDKKLNEYMKNPEVVKWLEDNWFEI